MDHEVLPGYGSRMYGTPRSPWPVQAFAGAKRWLCGGLTWQDLWQSPSEYEVAIVMTPMRPGDRDTVVRDHTHLRDPLMISRMSFTRATRPAP